MKKYVVSEEKWNFGDNLSAPDEFFLQSLGDDLKNALGNIFGKESIDFISERFLREGLGQLIAKNCPVVSLEKFYVDTPFHLEISRAVDVKLDSVGLQARARTKTIDEQISNLVVQGLREIIIVDDVLFSGGVWEIIEKIIAQGIKVKEFVCGISIGDGHKKLSECGLKVTSVLHYEDVIDEICHRDFYAGVPYSGRMVVNGTGNNVGAPYFYPFGKPIDWASIPEDRADAFSDFCLKQSLRLWKHMEHQYQQPIFCFQIDRLPLGAPNDNTRFVDYLESLF